MKKLGVSVLVAVCLALVPTTAYADHEWGGGGYRDGNCDYGNCGEREEEYGSGSCKYFCPEGRFDDSPVQDSFNICLPGATCYWDGQREGEGGGSGGGSGQPR